MRKFFEVNKFHCLKENNAYMVFIQRKVKMVVRNYIIILTVGAGLEVSSCIMVGIPRLGVESSLRYLQI